MKKIFIALKISILFTLFGFIISFTSCVKEPDLIGMSLQSSSDTLHIGFDSDQDIVAYSVIDDSLKTDNYINDILMARIYLLNGKQVPAYVIDKMLGTYNDAVFGTTSASIFTQYRLLTENPGLPQIPNCDSIILYLPYSGIYKASDYASKSYPLQIKVFQLTEKMSVDSSYYADRVLNYNTTPIANTTIIPNTTDSVTVDGIKYPPLLRIKLDNSFGNAFLNNPSYLIDNDVFTSNFKGLFIQSLPLNTTQDNKGAMVYFNLISNPYTSLSLYYKKTTGDSVSTRFNFVINDQCAKYTNFNHYKYNGFNSTRAADIDLQKQIGKGSFSSPDTTLGKQKLYLQSMGGVKVNLKFPNLRNSFKDKKVVINEATLVLKNIDQNDYNAPPPLIGAFKRLSGNTFTILPDHMEGFSFIDGTYNATTREYRIRITRYIQYLLNYSDTDYGLDLVIDRKKSIANRFIFGGTDKTLPNRVKLELKYTIIK